MSKKPIDEVPSTVDVKVELCKEKARRHNHGPVYMIEKGVAPKVSTMSGEFVYVNSAYSGSLNRVNEPTVQVQVPPTSVIREQYWACSRWPFSQRVLAIAVGVLLGAVVGLAVTMGIRRDDKDGGLGRLLRTHVAPD